MIRYVRTFHRGYILQWLGWRSSYDNPHLIGYWLWAGQPKDDSSVPRLVGLWLARPVRKGTYDRSGDYPNFYAATPGGQGAYLQSMALDVTLYPGQQEILPKTADAEKERATREAKARIIALIDAEMNEHPRKKSDWNHPKRGRRRRKTSSSPLAGRSKTPRFGWEDRNDGPS